MRSIIQTALRSYPGAKLNFDPDADEPTGLPDVEDNEGFRLPIELSRQLERVRQLRIESEKLKGTHDKR